MRAAGSPHGDSDRLAHLILSGFEPLGQHASTTPTREFSQEDE